jgi:hypothetical protein
MNTSDHTPSPRLYNGRRAPQHMHNVYGAPEKTPVEHFNAAVELFHRAPNDLARRAAFINFDNCARRLWAIARDSSTLTTAR